MSTAQFDAIVGVPAHLIGELRETAEREFSAACDEARQITDDASYRSCVDRVRRAIAFVDALDNDPSAVPAAFVAFLAGEEVAWRAYDETHLPSTADELRSMFRQLEFMRALIELRDQAQAMEAMA